MLCPPPRRPGVARRNAHTSSSRVRPRVGKSRHVVFALTTAVGHSVVRSIVTTYDVTGTPWRCVSVCPGPDKRIFGWVDLSGLAILVGTTFRDRPHVGPRRRRA